MGHTRRKPQRRNPRPGLWMIPFIIGLPFAMIFMLGDVMAMPLEKYRHTNLAAWLLWNVLRMSVPIALIAACAYFLIRSRLHR